VASAAGTAALEVVTTSWPHICSPEMGAEACNLRATKPADAHLVSLRLPFFILSTTGPLLQYGLRNLIKMLSPIACMHYPTSVRLALVTYPFVVEPELTLKAQAIVWSLLFVAFAIGVGLCSDYQSSAKPNSLRG
jgi:hypothetical protein